MKSDYQELLVELYQAWGEYKELLVGVCKRQESENLGVIRRACVGGWSQVVRGIGNDL